MTNYGSQTGRSLCSHYARRGFLYPMPVTVSVPLVKPRTETVMLLFQFEPHTHNPHVNENLTTKRIFINCNRQNNKSIIMVG